MGNIPNRADLETLLRAKMEAKTAMSAAYAACNGSDDHSIAAQLALDLDRVRALNAYCAADKAYDEAVKAHLAGAV